MLNPTPGNSEESKLNPSPGNSEKTLLNTSLDE